MSPGVESNHHPLASHASDLPLIYLGMKIHEDGIEPPASRLSDGESATDVHMVGWPGWNRTTDLDLRRVALFP